MGFNIKKSGFFVKSRWTVCIIMIILMGSLSQSYLRAQKKVEKPESPINNDSREGKSAAASIAELELRLKMTQKELGVLRKELAEVLKQSDKRDQEYLRLQMSIAASIADGNRKEYDKQNREILKSLYGITESGRELVNAATECSSFMKDILNQEEITDIDKARAKLRLSKLKSAAEKFHMRIQPRPKDLLFKSCRILTVNDKLQVVVLNVGATSGVRNGIFLRTKTGDCKLVVVAVRPFISAAVLTEGDLIKLARGTELVPGR